MKIYKIKINGKTYKVELEAMEEVASAPSAAEVKKEAPKAEVSPSSAGGKEVLSPIQGTVVNIPVKVGDKVKKGQTVIVIEAMKLENEVSTPFDGVVAEILVSKGQAVANKQVVIKIQ